MVTHGSFAGATCVPCVVALETLIIVDQVALLCIFASSIPQLASVKFRPSKYCINCFLLDCVTASIHQWLKQSPKHPSPSSSISDELKLL